MTHVIYVDSLESCNDVPVQFQNPMTCWIHGSANRCKWTCLTRRDVYLIDGWTRDLCGRGRRGKGEGKRRRRRRKWMTWRKRWKRLRSQWKMLELMETEQWPEMIFLLLIRPPLRPCFIFISDHILIRCYVQWNMSRVNTTPLLRSDPQQFVPHRGVI